MRALIPVVALVLAGCATHPLQSHSVSASEPVIEQTRCIEHCRMQQDACLQSPLLCKIPCARGYLGCRLGCAPLTVEPTLIPPQLGKLAL